MLFKLDSIFLRFVGPPGRDHIQRQSAVAADMIDVCGLLCEKCRLMKSRTHRDHQLQLFSNCGECGGGGPCVERRSVDALDVVEVELGNQRQVVTDLLAAPSQTTDVIPTRFHAFVFDVSQPTAENREPVTVAHRVTSSCKKSTSRTCGSKPTTRVASATKLESALMS